MALQFNQAAVLPDDKPETLALLQRHAYAFVQGTRVQWRYDTAASQVETTFSASTKVMEGPDNGPLYGLYPHHWFNNASVADKLGPAYDTVRGKIRLVAAPEFKTTQRYMGFVPYWPGVADAPSRAALDDVMKSDLRNARRMMLPEGQSAYWQGKGLQRIVKLMDVAEQQGNLEERDRLLAMLKKRMEEWFGGAEGKRYFFVDDKLGAVASYPDEFFAIAEVNDHHFWFGYWIRAAAEIALRDPAWAAKERWGGMVDLLVADIATAERGRLLEQGDEVLFLVALAQQDRRGHCRRQQQPHGEHREHIAELEANSIHCRPACPRGSGDCAPGLFWCCSVRGS